MFIHTFGAYFGLACSYTMSHQWQLLPKSKKKTFQTKDSLLFSMIGTVVLFISWPSFNAAICPNGLQHVCAINTVLSLTTCTAFAFLTSKLLTNSKFQIFHVQRATLAGILINNIFRWSSCWSGLCSF
jgi:ammonium transporter Rh